MELRGEERRAFFFFFLSVRDVRKKGGDRMVPFVLSLVQQQ